jgi:uroporphyrinogen-III synthase
VIVKDCDIDAMSSDLHGLTVLIPESRELDLFASMLEAQGAKTMRCPLVAILDVDDAAPVADWLKRLVAGAFDDLILFTGEGLKRLLAHAERLGLRDEAIGAIGRLRTIVRGPKPVRVLRELGLSPGISAPTPTSKGLIQALSGLELKGRRVALQLYPGASRELVDFLEAAGAMLAPVTPYRYASQAETDDVERAIRKLAAGEVDFVAFTSSPQVDRLADVARARGLESELRRGLERTRVAAVGPVVAASIQALGAKVAVQPKSFHLKPLVAAMAEAVGRKA